MNVLHVRTIGGDHKNEENETKKLHQTIEPQIFLSMKLHPLYMFFPTFVIAFDFM
jgi:hypothetical protein